MYRTKPTVFGDAHTPPFQDESFDTVVFTEVLEHLEHAEQAFKAVSSLIRTGGTMHFSMPFIYPIHDAPADFQRFTAYTIQRLFKSNSLHIESMQAIGNPVTTALLLLNIALAKTVLLGAKKRHPAILLICVMPVLIPLLNLIGWAAEFVLPKDDFMPHNYVIRATKLEPTGI